MRFLEFDKPVEPSLLRRGSSVRYINPLCEVNCRRKVEWIDQAELSAVACNSVPALTLLSGSTPPEKNPLSLCGGERVEPSLKIEQAPLDIQSLT